MSSYRLKTLILALGAIGLAAGAATYAAPPAPYWFNWTTVVNNTDDYADNRLRAGRQPSAACSTATTSPR